jgi:O6-methylguanine-DNA--protein-cysteine methyltransferase
LLAAPDFKKCVWQILQTILYGEIWRFSSLSQKLQNKKAIQPAAVANALSSIIPYHSITGGDRSLTNQADGFPANKKLL